MSFFEVDIFALVLDGTSVLQDGLVTFQFALYDQPTFCLLNILSLWHFERKWTNCSSTITWTPKIEQNVPLWPVPQAMTYMPVYRSWNMAVTTCPDVYNVLTKITRSSACQLYWQDIIEHWDKISLTRSKRIGVVQVTIRPPSIREGCKIPGHCM
jgi:hypothetical protein